MLYFTVLRTSILVYQVCVVFSALLDKFSSLAAIKTVIPVATITESMIYLYTTYL